MGSENLEEINEAREKITDRLKALVVRYQDLGARHQELDDELARLDAEEERIEKALEGASSEDKGALLFEAGERRREAKNLVEKLLEEIEHNNAEFDSIQEEMVALDERTGPAREELRTAAIETEKITRHGWKHW